MKNYQASLVSSLCFLLCLSSCKNQSCDQLIFSSNENRFFINLNKSFKLGSTCYHRYLIKSSSDSIDGYWGIKNDTMFLLRPDGLDFEAPNLVPLLPLNAKPGDRYNYLDVIQSKDILMPGDYIDVRISAIQYMQDDTLYSFSHTCMPPYEIMTTGKSTFPNITRYFVLSRRKGILNYKTIFKGNTHELKFHW